MAIFGDDKKTKEMTEEIISGISATIAESISKTMQPVFTKLAQEINSAVAESGEMQRKAANDMVESMNGMQKLMESISANMRSMQQLTDTQQKLVETLSRTCESQAATQAGLSAECETVFAGVKDIQIKLSSLYDDIGNGATALVAREEGIVKNQKKVLDKAAEDLIALQGRWTENFNKANAVLSTNYERMFKEMDTTVDSLSRYSEALAQSGRNMNESYASFSKNLEQSLTDFKSGMSSSLEEFKTGINTGFGNFTDHMEKSVSETFAAIDRQLGSAVETLGKTTEEINDAMSRLPKAIRGLN